MMNKKKNVNINKQNTRFKRCDKCYLDGEQFVIIIIYIIYTVSNTVVVCCRRRFHQNKISVINYVNTVVFICIYLLV